MDRADDRAAASLGTVIRSTPWRTFAEIFSASASSIFAGAYYAVHENGDAPGTVRATETLQAGTDVYVRKFSGPTNRWGDYTASAIDPGDGCFWVYNEYAMSKGSICCSGESGRWATRFGRVCLAMCGDGNVDSGEACDDAGESTSCNADCTRAA